MIRLILLVSVLGTPAFAVAEDATPPQPCMPPNAIERYVDEPIFQSRIRVVEAGKNNPETVLLVHGLGEAGACDWYGVLPALAAQYHVIAVDLPGFGKSEKRNLAYTPMLYASFIKWIAATEIRGPFTLIGHSMGGAISLRYASVWPNDLKRLVLVDVAGILHRAALAKTLVQQNVGGDGATGAGSRLKAWAGHLTEDFAKVPFDLGLLVGAESSRRIMLGGSTAKAAALSLIDEDFSLLLQRVTVPVALIWGDRDRIAPMRTARLLSARIPDARLCIIEDAGHEPMHDKPELFAQRLLAAIGQPLLAAASLPVAPTEARDGKCDDEKDKIFTGAWRRIDLRDCKGARIVDAVVGKIDAKDSEFTIEHSKIGGNGPIAIVLQDSDVVATGVWINAEIAVDLDDARIDFAGVDLQASKIAIQTHNKSIGLFSACRISSPITNAGLHGIFVLIKDRPL